MEREENGEKVRQTRHPLDFPWTPLEAEGRQAWQGQAMGEARGTEAQAKGKQLVSRIAALCNTYIG